MTPDEEQVLIGKFTQEAWNVWVKAGWLEGIQKEMGTLHGERERRIFESAWKLGFGHSMEVGREIAARIANRN